MLLYCCFFKLNHFFWNVNCENDYNYFHFNPIQFLSLRGKDKFMIRSLTINIQQQFDNCSQKVSGTFDMNKLKSDIEGMGDTVSERALDFLKTMELYEQVNFKHWIWTIFSLLLINSYINNKEK